MPIDEIIRVFLQSNAEDRTRGMNAYKQYHNRILEVDNRWRFFNPEGSCGAFAALSPNNDESGNFRDLSNLLKAWDECKDMSQVEVSTYRLNRDKAAQIIRGAPPLSVLGGNKTRAFFSCLFNPDDRYSVVVDGHMYSIWHGRRFRMSEAKLTDSLYARISEDIRVAAANYRLLPSQMQAVCWFAWKRIHDIRYVPSPRAHGQLQFNFDLCSSEEGGDQTSQEAGVRGGIPVLSADEQLSEGEAAPLVWPMVPEQQGLPEDNSWREPSAVRAPANLGEGGGRKTAFRLAHPPSR